MLAMSKWIFALVSSAIIIPASHASVVDDKPLPPELHFYQPRALPPELHFSGENQLPPELHIQQKGSLSPSDSRIATVAEKRPIFIHTFIHDDVTEPQSEIYAKHFLPMVNEIKGFTGRHVSVQFIRHLPTYTDFAYKHENSQETLNRWHDQTFKYKVGKKLPSEKTTKFLLITKDVLNTLNSGVAHVGGQVAISSLKSERHVGHEVGHTLNATHEDSDKFFNGWWCDSYMVLSPTFGHSNCNRYSDANRERINTFLSNVP